MDKPTPVTEVLSYRVPDKRPMPSPLLASLLAAPGLFCWMALLAAMTHRWTGWYPPLDLLLFVWCVAILAAIVSVGMYIPSRKPWYVMLCLAVNISGLLLTTAIFCLFLLL